MAEWSNAADSKSVVPIGYRGFESLSLRHFPKTRWARLAAARPSGEAWLLWLVVLEDVAVHFAERDGGVHVAVDERGIRRGGRGDLGDFRVADAAGRGEGNNQNRYANDAFHDSLSLSGLKVDTHPTYA